LINKKKTKYKTMATETTTLTLPLNHLYYLTADGNNDTGYTLEEVQALIDEKGGEFEIEATITHPVPPPYTVEGDIAAHQERITNNEQYLTTLREELSGLEEGTDEYTRLEEQIAAVEADIQNSKDYIQSLQTT
jgi:DNA-binding transcriptional MerR regulator